MSREEGKHPLTALSLLAFLPGFLKFYVVRLLPPAMLPWRAREAMTCPAWCQRQTQRGGCVSTSDNRLALSSLQIPGPLRYLAFLVKQALLLAAYHIRKAIVLAGVCMSSA